MMTPAPGERRLQFSGDRVRFVLSGEGGRPLPEGYRGILRTNLGRAAVLRDEIVRSYAGKLPLAGASWRDIPMTLMEGKWVLEMPVTEVGYFKAKAYAVDGQGRQYWPDGPDAGISVHPNSYRTGNTLYCAFVRLFGENKAAQEGGQPDAQSEIAKLDRQGYAVIPPSGKLRDLVARLPHIMDTLECKILHLLPVNPVPTTYARFGRFGSPYAAQDLTAIDPALVEFDRRKTGVDQFRELTYAVHLKGGRVFLDIVINHTGWGSREQETHPEWFLKDDKGFFASPGAWGTVWEDLVELDHRNSAAWGYLAEVFLIWRRRGVDGFRCDAGYKVPMPAWRYIIARVRQHYPETIFLLEGLGGSWEATEILLTEGGMQWAYSELFQNYSGREVGHYLDYALGQSQRVGLYTHYSETHDNDRLAKRGREWSLLRNRLCGLTSVSGGFGFTCGVEWLSKEKIYVHQRVGLNWGAPDNLAAELGCLNRLLLSHPCFFDHARLKRLSSLESPVYAVRRDSDEGLDQVLVLANTDAAQAQEFILDQAAYLEMRAPRLDLLTLAVVEPVLRGNGDRVFRLPPAGCVCLAAEEAPRGLSGNAYRSARARAAWALNALSQALPVEQVGPGPWRKLAERVDADAVGFLGSFSRLDPELACRDLLGALRKAGEERRYPAVIRWELLDAARVTVVPPGHWLLAEDKVPFRAALCREPSGAVEQMESIEAGGRWIVAFAPQAWVGEGRLSLERYGPGPEAVEGAVRFLPSTPEFVRSWAGPGPSGLAGEVPTVLLTNAIGGMARLCVDFGRVQSKYDCLLGANLHPQVPVDRHVFAKRARLWVNADGFISPLDQRSLVGFEPGIAPRWRFVANAGDGRSVEIHLTAWMAEGMNTVALRLIRPVLAPALGRDLPERCAVRLTVRVDLEDRSFHGETKRNPGADHHFGSHSRPLGRGIGFEFTPAVDRQVRVVASAGRYHHEAEWCENIPHPVEGSRGQVDAGDCFSPGWFEIPLAKGDECFLTVTSEPLETVEAALAASPWREGGAGAREEMWQRPAGFPERDTFGRQLAAAARSFVVRRGAGKTVIAGYPWFLDWGRDTLICARGLLAAGMAEEVEQLLATYGRFEAGGTIPNSIFGEDASNRETSDAPLWFGIVCEEAAALMGRDLSRARVDGAGRSLTDVLKSIATGYMRGAANGVRMDAASGLIWSPSHFTWMDTNYPACTPRAGYPIEIQVLWIRLLRQLERLNLEAPPSGSWGQLADKAEASARRYFWMEEKGYFADCLIAETHQPADRAIKDSALRSNCLFAVSLGIARGEQARRCVEAAARYLAVPGALRSLAPLPAHPPLEIRGRDGRLLNDPENPYQGRYEGDEDTRRKPAYHNGTAWTWTFPTFCEALAMAWEFAPEAVAAARAYLGSMAGLLNSGCLGQIPEIVDGDAPHAQRGCDAQAWSVTEALRVWKLLNAAQDRG